MLVTEDRRTGRERLGPLAGSLLLQLAANLGDLAQAQLAGLLGEAELGRHLGSGGRQLEQGELLGAIGAVR